MITRLILFLVLNFAALALGGLFTGDGVSSSWYAGLNKAPWTPPGWVFGFAWTSIMICYSIYLTRLWPRVEDKKGLIALYAVQWILNVSWNPIFFYYQKLGWSMLVIAVLSLTLGYHLWRYRAEMKRESAWLWPYGLWLVVACSLNAYILLMN